MNIESRGYMPVSQSTDWETPKDLFDFLHNIYHFDLDPCAIPGQYTAETIISNGGMAYCPPWIIPPTTSWYNFGLSKIWHGNVYMNPPYGRGIEEWIKKAVEEVKDNRATNVVALLPVRTDTKWWQKYITSYINKELNIGPICLQEVVFLPGRLKFGGATNFAPFPSCLVRWGGHSSPSIGPVSRKPRWSSLPTTPTL